jgi:hypothetical protein
MLGVMISAGVMKSEWETMTVDDLFELHEQMSSVLRTKLVAQRDALEWRLHQLKEHSRLLAPVNPKLQKLLVFGSAFILSVTSGALGAA